LVIKLAHGGTLALLLVAVLLAPVQAQQSSESLEQQMRQAERTKTQLRERIERIEQQLKKTNKQYQRATDALRESELAISDATRRLKALDQSVADLESALALLAKQIKTKQADLGRDRQALAMQLRSQHSSNLSPWSAVLAGEDPQAMGRELGYLSFVADARVKTIERLREGVTELSELEADQTQQSGQLTEQQAAVKLEQADLRRQQQARQALLAKLEGAIAAERAERDKLTQDDQQLTTLIEGLSEQIEQVKSDAHHASAIRKDILEALPQGEGLKRGIPMPLKGQVLARYGSSRPDGGDWRGVLIGAKSGTPVRAVASGTVVYSTWLRGFGNLIIVDHGDEFLTVYAYNQSLLKQVGQTVKAGDVIADAGNSGGQLDSALYFEIRHRGVPLDPQLYFKR
jgi:septal ring factor EnvC (AmiA/AmiB activator)